MAPLKTLTTCCLVLAVLTLQTQACGRQKQDDDTDSDSGSHDDRTTSANACCLCGQPMTMKIVAKNVIQEPYFEIDAEVKGEPQKELLHMLEVAATQDKRFRFSSEHFGSMGYMITSLNELSASTANKTYWRIHSSAADDQAIQMGVSLYIPIDGESITFNFTSWA